MLNTLNYRAEWIEMINTLPDQNDRNALIAAITMYQFNGQTPTLSPALNLVFLFIKKEIDIILQQLKAVEERKEARRAKRIAKPRTQQAQQPEQPSRPEESLYKQSIPEVPPQKTSKTTPPSKNKKFNSILRAKERHDRLKHRSHPS